MKNIVILGGARDYHAMDWYRTVNGIVSGREVSVLTDLIGGEGYDIIVSDDDNISKLFIIDRFLFRKQSTLGNIWRNLFKLLVLPVQVYLLKKYVIRNPRSIFHAQPMYYMFLCWLSGVDFIGTPQGSEILVRPKKSLLYRYMASKALKAASCVTVDSKSMQERILEISGVDAVLIQNGVDVDSLTRKKNQFRTKVTSIRGMTDLYRICEILDARNNTIPKLPVNFIYPFLEDDYYDIAKKKFRINDVDLGRLSRPDMYRLLSESYLVISTPSSDSSPRSVYEAIFAGCSVAVTYNPWIEALPACMRERVFIVDLSDDFWLLKAIEFSKPLVDKIYTPSQEALNMFDQKRTMKNAIELLYE